VTRFSGPNEHFARAKYIEAVLSYQEVKRMWPEALRRVTSQLDS
jgi:hypothetical protein